MRRARRRTAQSVSWEVFYEQPIGRAGLLSWANAHAPVIDQLLDSRRILEVGTGTGALSGLLSRWADLCISVDSSKGVLGSAMRSAADLRSRVQFLGGDAVALPFRDSSFDAAFSQGFFEHFDDRQIHALLAEQTRVAHRVVFSVPNRLYPHLGRWGPGLVGNERLLSTRQWTSVLARWRPTVVSYRDPKVLSVAGRSLGPKLHTLVVIDGR